MRNIEFKTANAVFQNQLNKDIDMISKDPRLFIHVAKPKNLDKKGNKKVSHCKNYSLKILTPVRIVFLYTL